MAQELDSWQVTSQVHDQVINTQANETITGTYVYFATNLGESASVFIPDNEYAHIERNKTRIDHHAKLVNRYRRLTSETRL